MRRSLRIQQKTAKEEQEKSAKRAKVQETKSAKYLYSIINPTTETKIDQLWNSRGYLESKASCNSVQVANINSSIDSFRTELDRVSLDVNWLKKDSQSYHRELNSTLRSLTQTIGDLASRITSLEERFEEDVKSESDREE